ncbi:MAG: GAF domain-containing sensor histidine kinase [Nocardioides sp.]
MTQTDSDERRVAGIAQYDVLRHAPRIDLLAIVELAARVCGTPMATINLITDTEQHQVATFGFDAGICSREDSMCAHVLDQDTPIVVADASLDPRFQDNPFVTGVIGHVRFYASHKLITHDGVTIGTLCVFDEATRELDEAQVEALATLAERIVDALELSLRSRQLAASNDRLASFAGRVSHDLKSPLTSITMSLSLLQEQLADEVDPEHAAWLLERALSGSQRMAAMIDEVLAFASLGGGGIAARPTDLEDVLDDVLADLERSLSGVPVSRSALPTVMGDAVQLRSVLQNVLDNASKYRDDDRSLEIAVAAERVGESWRITVADNGRGIPEADRERVFAPRVRLRDDGSGSGIGLDTVRRVIQAHGGSIGITGTAGGGTTVWFDLPA